MRDLSRSYLTPLGRQWIVHGNSCWVRNVFGLSLRSDQPTKDGSGQRESDSLIISKHCDVLRRFCHNAIAAQCSECQSDEIQTGVGKRRK